LKLIIEKYDYYYKRQGKKRYPSLKKEKEKRKQKRCNHTEMNKEEILLPMKEKMRLIPSIRAFIPSFS